MVSVSIYRYRAKRIIMHTSMPLETIQDGWGISRPGICKKESLPIEIPKRLLLFDIESYLQQKNQSRRVYHIDRAVTAVSGTH